MTGFLKNKWLLILVVLGGVGAFWLTRRTSAPTADTLGTVTRADLINRTTLSGTVVPKHKTMLTAPYNGYVRKIHVSIGSHVKAGDPVIAIAQSLSDPSRDIFPMRAPFSGTVVQVLKSEGEYVEQSGAARNLLRIDDLSQLFVEGTAPEIEVEKLRLGQEAVIKATAVLGRSYKGKVKHLALASKEMEEWNKSRVEFPYSIELLDFDSQLKPGMSVVVDIITHKLSQVLTLRHEFIEKNGENYFVLTQGGEKKPISIGAQNEEVFEVKSGVSEGDKVRLSDFLSVLKPN